ncbi:MAG: hypothetical protein LBC60_02910 [Spirochaetaceae bacterium]|jgi:hypothetical protein|nr:hypothetical protein [Spirochaetaceae bacterium]
MAKHVIPRSKPAFDRFFKNNVDYVVEMTGGPDPVWTHIPPGEVAALSAAYETWSAAYTPTLSPHTPAAMAAMKTAYVTTGKVLSRFIQVWFRGFPEIVTTEHLWNLGIPPIDAILTAASAPMAQAEADLVFPGIHLVELLKIRPVPGVGVSPPSGCGVRIFYVLSGPPTEKYPFRVSGAPSTGSQFPYSVFTREKNHRFDFEGESGNRIYFCLRYENSKGGEGPFGPILSAVIP